MPLPHNCASSIDADKCRFRALFNEYLPLPLRCSPVPPPQVSQLRLVASEAEQAAADASAALRDETRRAKRDQGLARAELAAANEKIEVPACPRIQEHATEPCSSSASYKYSSTRTTAALAHTQASNTFLDALLKVPNRWRSDSTTPSLWPVCRR